MACPDANCAVRRIYCGCPQCSSSIGCGESQLPVSQYVKKVPASQGLPTRRLIRHPFGPMRPHISPWHLPPDIYEWVYGVAFNPAKLPTFCIVRSPKERFVSDALWAEHQVPAFSSSGAEIFEQLKQGASSSWTEETLHRMPQHMFVWSANGSVQCDCVVAFEKLSRVTSIHTNMARKNATRAAELAAVYQYDEETSKTAFSSSFAKMYEMDLLLWERAKATPDLCYQPTSLKTPIILVDPRGQRNHTPPKDPFASLRRIPPHVKRMLDEMEAKRGKIRSLI